MKILLTGATGYLGSCLAKALVAGGHKLIILKRNSSDLYRLEPIIKETAFYDISNQNISNVFTNYGGVDAVVHLATCYGRNNESANQIFEANTSFPLRLLEAAISANVSTFINTDTVLSPYLNSYALSKAHFREWGRQLSSDCDIRFINIRLEHFFGPGDDSSKFTTWLVESCVNNVTEIKLTAGEQSREFIYIDDVVSAYLCLLLHATKLGDGFQEIGLGSGKPVRVRHLVEQIHQLSNSTTKLLFGTIAYRQHEEMESLSDISVLERLGWKCQTTLIDGITKIIEGVKIL